MDAEPDFRFVISILIIAVACVPALAAEIKMVEKFHFKSIFIYMNIEQ